MRSTPPIGYHVHGHTDINLFRGIHIVMRPSIPAYILAIALSPIAIAQSAFAQAPANTTSQPARRAEVPPIKLAVLIVIDQFRGDFPTRFAPYFGADGFRRLSKNGATFHNAHLTYGCSTTAAGHATIATGRLPRQHGIVGNRWFLATEPGKAGLPVSDGECKLLGPADKTLPGKSSRTMIGAAIGDQLKLSSAESRVFSIAWKDRAAIFMGAKRPDWAVWFETDLGEFVTSTWYLPAFPKSIDVFNQLSPADRYAGKSWDRILPHAAYQRCWSVDEEALKDNDGVGPRFPHDLPELDNRKSDARFYKALAASPYANDVLVAFVEHTLTEEKIGRGSAPDMLGIGFSANDNVGHIFGPDSPEVLDMTARTDAQIAKLLTALDKSVGLANCLIVVTADHGVTSPPALTKVAGIGGGWINVQTLLTELNSQLKSFKVGEDESVISGIEWPWVYFDRAFYKLDAATRTKLMNAGAEYLRTIPGVEAVYTADDLSGPCPSRDDLYRWLAWRSFHPQRSGELYIQMSPHWHKAPDHAAGHSAASSHDRHVTLMLSGPGVKPGDYYGAADLLDIAPTMAALLGIEPPPDGMGRVLSEALEQQRR